MSQPTSAAASQRLFDPERELGAFRPSPSLWIGLVLCLLPYGMLIASALSSSSMAVRDAQYDAGAVVFPIAALLALAYALLEVLAGAVRGPRWLSAALILALAAFAGFQLVRSAAFL